MITVNNVLNDIIKKVKELDHLLADYGLERSENIKITSISLRDNLDIDIEISMPVVNTKDDEEEE